MIKQPDLPKGVQYRGAQPGSFLSWQWQLELGWMEGVPPWTPYEMQTVNRVFRRYLHPAETNCWIVTKHLRHNNNLEFCADRLTWIMPLRATSAASIADKIAVFYEKYPYHS